MTLKNPSPFSPESPNGWFFSGEVGKFCDGSTLKFDFVEAEKCPCLVHFVSSSDACDRWADKNQKYWPDYFINLCSDLLVLFGPKL